MSVPRIKNLTKLFMKCNNIITKVKYNDPSNYNLNIISHYMKNYYINNENDWYEYVNINKTGYKDVELYTDDLTGISMSLITWCPNSFTNIHSHVCLGGIFMPLVGNINQKIYHNLNLNNVFTKEKNIMGYCENMIIKEGETYSYDYMLNGHSLSNNGNFNVCSLHIYDNNLII